MKIYTAKLSETPESELRRGYYMMDDARKSAVLRYRGDKDKRRTVLGELLARKAIAENTGIDEKDIEFGRQESGKPYAKNVEIEFSISHSKDMVVCAVSESKIGIDVELIRDMDMRITKIACTENDLEYIFGAKNAGAEGVTPDSDMLLRFFRLWTAKEAYLKYCGTGISRLKSVDYYEIEPFCKSSLDGDYIITVYSRRDVHNH